jgi:hypothetical protein
MNVLPVRRHAALSKELELLDRTVQKLLPEDLKLARIADLQDLGGSSNSEELGVSWDHDCRNENKDLIKSGNNINTISIFTGT